MTAKNSGNALVPLRTLFNVGAIGALSDAQLLEQFATGRGESRELAFAALVERHGPFVLRVCRSVLRDESAAEDAFQATFLALARKAGSLWIKDSLAPWLHQAAYRAAVHDRSAAIRRRSREHAAAALRPESVRPPHHANDNDLEKIIHEEIDRLPGRFRVAVVLCDLEGRTHEQAANHLGCAVGTVKSRLARGRTRLRGRLVRRGVAPALALAAASAGGAARAAVPASLAESTVIYAATASAAPASIAIITEGVLRSMFLSRVKPVMTILLVVTALAAGAVALAQSGIGESKKRVRKPESLGAPGWSYHILASRNGAPPREVAFIELDGNKPVRVEVPGALIIVQPRSDGEPDRQSAAEKRRDEIKVETTQKNRRVVLTNPRMMDVSLTTQYVCKVRAFRNMSVRAPEKGSLGQVLVKEGQKVKKGDVLFRIVTQGLNAQPDAGGVMVTAPFDGIIGRLDEQQGRLVNDGETLTTLSDHRVAWVDFNVPERAYLDYIANKQERTEDRIELMLANGQKFPHLGKIGALEAAFNSETGNIAFRADFPNSEGLLRPGQSSTILISRTLHDAIVIPQRATFEILDKRYVYVVDQDDVAHRREIAIDKETDDIFVVKTGVGVDNRIVLDGLRQVHDGEKITYDFRTPEEVIRKPANRAE